MMNSNLECGSLAMNSKSLMLGKDGFGCDGCVEERD